MKFPEKRNGFGVEKCYTVHIFLHAKNRRKNAPKPIHALDSRTILESYPKCEKSYQLVTFQKMSYK